MRTYEWWEDYQLLLHLIRLNGGVGGVCVDGLAHYGSAYDSSGCVW